MSKADQIRDLAAEGLKPAEIAKRLGIRYQHAYNVVNAGNGRIASQTNPLEINLGDRQGSRPSLTVELLIAGGFQWVSRWMLSGEHLVLEMPVPREVGVYAFVRSGKALYVGVATMGLSKRLYFYGRPGISLRTSQRLNAKIKAELAGLEAIEIVVAIPPDLEWNGSPIHGSAGLELGLIKKYALPWNMRGANR